MNKQLPSYVKIYHGRYYYRRDIPARLRGYYGKTCIKIRLGPDYCSAMSNAAAITKRIDMEMWATDKGEHQTMIYEKDPPLWVKSLTMPVVDAQRNASEADDIGYIMYKARMGDNCDAEDIAASGASDAWQKRLLQERGLTPTAAAPQTTVEQAVEQWLKYKQNRRKAAEGSMRKYRGAGEELKWAFGAQTPVASVTSAVATKYGDLLASSEMPPLKARKEGKMTLDNCKLATDVDAVSENYKANMRANISNCLHWWKTSGLTAMDLAEGLADIKFETSDTTKDAMPEDLITALHGQLLQYKDAACPYDVRWRYWVMMCLLYTGARPGEICQLHLSDILSPGDADPNSKTRDAVTMPCFAITPDIAGGTKSTKTDNAPRTVPIHSWLLNNGFLEYVRNRAESPGDYPEQVFPLGHYKAHGSAHNAGKFYNPLIRSLGAPKSITMYSTRHSAVLQWAQASLTMQQYAITEAIIGHSDPLGKLHRTYSGRDIYSLEDKQTLIEMLKYPI